MLSRFFTRREQIVMCGIAVAILAGSAVLAAERWRGEDGAAQTESDTRTHHEGPSADYPIDLNTATPAELASLPGIGPTLAQRIIEHRGKNPFASVEDLTTVPGIGPKRLEGVRRLVCVGKRIPPRLRPRSVGSDRSD